MTIDYRDLDWNIARTRIFVSVVGLLSISSIRRSAS
jgi:hypothetical protein